MRPAIPHALIVGGVEPALEHAVTSRSFRVSSASPAEAVARLESGRFEAVLVDARGPDGRSLIPVLAERFPDVTVIAMLASGADGDAFDALRAGATETAGWPVSPEELGYALDRAVQRTRQVSTVSDPPSFPASKLLGSSPAMKRVHELIERIAPGDATVLIRGETGTGKELVARALHEHSERSAKPFIKTHVAALPDALLESELFGYEKGAFTGAAARKPGRVELAQGGTLFLDEIGELSPAVQVKLLRLIQDREYERLGGTQALKADVRFITATHRDLQHMVEQGSFREDLYYRLNVVSIWMPPLRARRDDVPLLVRASAERFASAAGKPTLEFDEAAIALLRAQRWPGNVRQLLNLVERLVVLSPGPIVKAEEVRRELEEQVSFATQASQAGDVPIAEGGSTVGPSFVEGVPSTVRPLREEVRRAERRALEKALSSAQGNRSLAARMLGVSRRTLYTKLDEHDLE